MVLCEVLRTAALAPAIAYRHHLSCPANIQGPLPIKPASIPTVPLIALRASCPINRAPTPRERYFPTTTLRTLRDLLFLLPHTVYTRSRHILRLRYTTQRVLHLILTHSIDNRPMTLLNKNFRPFLRNGRGLPYPNKRDGKWSTIP